VLSEQLYEQYAAVQLRQPFETSLQEKKRLMESTLGALAQLVDYEVGDVTAAATFYMAEVYHGFSRSLIQSERPAGMQADELKEYELALEDEAFPLEDRSIEVHEKNMELMRSGIYNVWIDRSLSKLAELAPARYAKGEISSGFVGSLDRYAYTAPLPATGSGAGEQQPSAESAEPGAPAKAPAAAEPAADPVHTSQVEAAKTDEVTLATAH